MMNMNHQEIFNLKYQRISSFEPYIPLRTTQTLLYPQLNNQQSLVILKILMDYPFLAISTPYAGTITSSLSRGGYFVKCQVIPYLGRRCHLV